MMISPCYILPGENGFKGNLLDDYLAAGYYRMLHTMFTVHHTPITENGYSMPVFWIRTHVNNIHENKATLAIRKKYSHFTVACTGALITAETEELYTRYYNAVNFTTSVTCYDCMHDNEIPAPFNSQMIEIRHNGKLIAAGYFDLGCNAITGILNFYDPVYKKYSLGKMLMLQKIEWALANGIEWYYTGYISTGTNKFDYKLFPDTSAIEVFLPVEEMWVSFNQVGKPGLIKYWGNYFT